MTEEMRPRREEHAAETRSALVAVARRLFAQNGYAATSVAAIAGEARVTTGALYHQFGDKRGLFVAVAELVEAEIMQAVIAAAAGASDLQAGIRAGVEAMLRAAASPEVYRVAFVEAATVIGPQQWREIEMKYAFGALHAALADLEARGELKGLSADTLAPMLLGALHEAAVTIAEAADKDAARMNAGRAIGRMLDGLIPPSA